MRWAKANQKIILYLYGELKPKEEAALMRPLKKCKSCRRSYSEYAALLPVFQELSSKSSLNDISPVLWEKSWQAIEKSTLESQSQQTAPKGERKIIKARSLAWVGPLILITALAGFFLYRALSKSVDLPAIIISERRMANYLREYKSDLKPLLLMVTDFQPEKEEFILIEKKYTWQLLIENKLLRSYLWRKDPVAVEFPNDLEIIPKDICYLDKIDPITLEMIKKLIQENRVFLEINNLRKY